MDRTERVSRHLRELEQEYVVVLKRALANCAGGRWGLFGHNEHLDSSVAPPTELEELRSLARSINRLRSRNGDELYPLHEELEAARGPVGANDPGEPKQAQAWLKRLPAT
jgi:hypothetical protein